MPYISLSHCIHMQREKSCSLPINDTMNNNNEAGLTSNAPQSITQHVQFHLGAYEDIMQLSALYIIHDIHVKKKGNTIGNEFKEKAKCSSKRQIGIWARTPARQRYLEIRSMISCAPRKFITAYTDTRGKVPRPMCQPRNPWQPMKSIF